VELIRLEDIYKTYHLGEVDVPVLRGISLSIARGEMVALMGASGSGKTTLMNILGCLDHPSSGRYWLDGREMSRLAPNQRALVRAEKLGFVFQNFNLLPRTTALQNVVMPLDYAARRPSSAEAGQLGRALLDRVGLSDRVEHEPSQMSGGQQQRVAIGRSLVNHPALVLADEPTGNLDSHTSIEILRMFQQLNSEGITVVLVTHDPKVAAFAHRTIQIVDGQIDNDGDPAAHLLGTEVSPAHDSSQPADHPPVLSSPSGRGAEGEGSGKRAEIAQAPGDGRPHPSPVPEGKGPLGGHAPKPQRRGLPALVPHTFRTALGALRRNKMRSALSALGVIIAVGAVIAMMEIGQGSKVAMQRTIASMGANMILVLPGAALSGGVSFGGGSVQTLTPRDMEEIAKQCPAVSTVAPAVRARAQVVYGNRNWNTQQIIGTTPSYLAVRDWEELDEGNVFADRDVRNRSKVCLVGATLKRELFQGESPIGKDVRIQNVSFRVIGVLGRKGANMVGQDQDDIVIAPWTTVKYLISGVSVNAVQAAASAATNQVNSLNNPYPAATPLYSTPSATQLADTPQPIRFLTVDQIMAKAATAEQIPQAIEQMTSLLHERHHIRPDQENDFNLRDMTELTKTMAATSALMSALLLAVAAISLVVGGVGIMNIMLVSVTERTREIGLRMAVGARSHHILRQFLVEAVVLCLFGGALGIALGRGASMLVRSLLHWPTETSLPAVIAAVAVSASVGMVFGFYPAWKASRLDPIEALRYE
jgi:macrolide transport system ATP-binding/permease protein